jgi:hypothetical protein
MDCNRLLLFGEKIPVYSENHTKRINNAVWPKSIVLKVKAGGTYILFCKVLIKAYHNQIHELHGFLPLSNVLKFT